MSETLNNNVESLTDWKERRDQAPSKVANELESRLSGLENPTEEDKADALWGMLADYQRDIQTNYYEAKTTAETLHPLVGNPVERYMKEMTPTEDVLEAKAS